MVAVRRSLGIVAAVVALVVSAACRHQHAAADGGAPNSNIVARGVPCTASSKVVWHGTSLFPLREPEAFSKSDRVALAIAAAYLQQGGDDASEFYASIGSGADASIVRVELWHCSGLTPANESRLGNPSGRNRTLVIDLAQRRVLRAELWQ
jgi:hypothetical protein